MKTKTGRRFLSAIIALVMLLGTGTISFSTLAADGETVTDGDITYVISNGCITDVTVKDDAVLENYTVPAKVGNISINSIGVGAFSGTKITTLTISETVTLIKGGAFYDCGISKVIFNSPYCEMNKSTNAYTNQSYFSINPVFFGNAELTEFEFGSKVGSIPAYVCTNISSLETVKFNKTVSKIGECAFYGCSALNNIDLSNLTVIGKAAFNGCNSLDIIELPQVTDIGEKAFMNCGSPSKVSFPKAATIGACAFAQTVMDIVTIPETVTSIGGGAFYDCGISKVIFNAPYCEMNKSTNAYTNQSYFSINPVFFGNASLKEFEFGSKVGSVPAYVCTNVSSLETVKFNKTVSKIGECAFYGCSALNSIDLSDLSAIGKDAFNGCNSLDIIELPQVTDIGEKAFMNCGSPSKVSFQKAATIGACAFAQTVMDTVTIPETVTSIGGGAFYDCGISKVFFNAPVCDVYTSTYAYTDKSYLLLNPAFFGNASLTEIEFGTNVESIPANVCTNVYALQKVSFRAAVTKIGNNAFYGCQTPDEIIYAGAEDQWNALKDKSEKTGNDSLFKCTNIKYTVNPITEYTVTFNANGGDVTPEAQKVEENATIILPDSTKANFTFLGWSLDKNATTATYLAGSTYKVTGNVTLYAVWEAIDEPAEKTFTDSASDVQVTDNNNAFGGKDVIINVEVTSSDAELDKKIHDFALTKASEIYNISFTYNGEEIQPNGMVKVRIPYDKEIKDPSKIKVFHYHENSNGEMVFSKISNVTILPGYIEFETDSFSKFVVAEEITISINGNSKMQYKGTQTLKVETNGEVEFTSSNPKVVSVDENGKVTATGKGTATITATVKGTDVSTSINITVSYTWWQWIIRIVLFGWIWY